MDKFNFTIINIMQYIRPQDVVPALYVNKEIYDSTKNFRKQLINKQRKKLWDIDDKERTYREWYPNGQLRGKAQFSGYTFNYLDYDIYIYKHGDVFMWYPNGILEKHLKYMNGKFHGKQIYYNEEGNIIAEYKYNHGLEHGTQVNYHVYDKKYVYHKYVFGVYMPERDTTYDEKLRRKSGFCRRCGRIGHVKKECTEYMNVFGESISYDAEFDEITYHMINNEYY